MTHVAFVLKVSNVKQPAGGTERVLPQHGSALGIPNGSPIGTKNSSTQDGVYGNFWMLRIILIVIPVIPRSAKISPAKLRFSHALHSYGFHSPEAPWSSGLPTRSDQSQRLLHLASHSADTARASHMAVEMGKCGISIYIPKNGNLYGIYGKMMDNYD